MSLGDSLERGERNSALGINLDDAGHPFTAAQRDLPDQRPCDRSMTAVLTARHTTSAAIGLYFDTAE